LITGDGVVRVGRRIRGDFVCLFVKLKELFHVIPAGGLILFRACPEIAIPDGNRG